MPQKVKRFAVKVALMCITLVVSLVIADFVLRIAFHIPTNFGKEIIWFDPTHLPHKRLKPNLNVELTGPLSEFKFRLTTDSEGFRKSYPQGAGDSKKYDIVFLGDSQTAGVGMDDQETFPSYVGKKLNKAVLNTGCYGYSTVEELQMVQLILKQYNPKLVILCFFSGNDPFENFQHQHLLEGAATQQSMVSKKLKLGLSPAKEFFKKNSAIYNLMTRLRRFEAINNIFYRFNLVDKVPPMELLVYQKNDSALKTQFWSATKKALLKINEVLQAHDIQLLIINIPDKCYVYPDYWDGWTKKYRIMKNDYDLLGPARYLQTYCDRHAIPFLDLNERFYLEQKKGRSLYWKMDHHLATEGNQVIAEVVAEYVKEKFGF